MDVFWGCSGRAYNASQVLRRLGLEVGPGQSEMHEQRHIGRDRLRECGELEVRVQKLDQPGRSRRVEQTDVSDDVAGLQLRRGLHAGDRRGVAAGGLQVRRRGGIGEKPSSQLRARDAGCGLAAEPLPPQAADGRANSGAAATAASGARLVTAIMDNWPPARM
jgi:hypothetical protein